MADIIERRSEATNLTPMMKQYLEIKEQYEFTVEDLQVRYRRSLKTRICPSSWIVWIRCLVRVHQCLLTFVLSAQLNCFDL